MTDCRSAGVRIGNDSAERQILRAICSIGYGSVEMIIHDGHVVQIECREKSGWRRRRPRKTAVRRSADRAYPRSAHPSQPTRPLEAARKTKSTIVNPTG